MARTGPARKPTAPKGRVGFYCFWGCAMAHRVKVGLVFSTTGSYATVSGEMLKGARLAVGEVNAGQDRVRLDPRLRNPGGELNGYWHACQDLLKNEGVRHVVGCYTSASRKEVIPLFEKYDGLLWYPSHYEGFESADNVVYTGAAPNQHIVPLAAYMLRHHGRRAYFCGSNYIWAWENNRILREILTQNGGEVVAERYRPIGDDDIEPLLDEIAELKPDFIFNTLIGETAYAFYRRYRERGYTDPRFQPDVMPVTSCSLSEPELRSIGADAAAGHICSSVYFSTFATAANDRFRAAFANAGYDPDTASADAEASYDAVHLLAQGLIAAGASEPEAVLSAAYTVDLDAPQGTVRIDRTNNHCYLTPRLGRSRRNGTFAVIASAAEPVRPDPYLTRFDARALFQADLSRSPDAADGPTLKVVK